MRERVMKACGPATGAIVALALCFAASAATAEPKHGISVFGDLKYGPDFAHFEYVNPDAPKGGEMRLSFIGSFDNLNPYILKGDAAEDAGLQFDTLMAAAGDEPDALYGLVAEGIELAPDRSWALFTLRSEARWHDGSPITPEDVVFSFETLKSKGHPRLRLVYRDIEGAEAVAPNQVRFRFKPVENRDLPVIAAGLPVLSKAYFSAHPFERTTLEPIMGSGPYRVAKVEPGRSVTYRRVTDYWARDLAVNRGRYNLDVIRYDYYRDRDVAMEAFKSGDYDFREEFTSKVWATGYNFPAIERGWVVRETLPDARPAGTQAFFLNVRLDKFAHPKVREAIGYAFDYEWLNKNMFHGQYGRTRSMFQNSPLAASGPPSTAESAVLEAYRDQLPAHAFTQEYNPPATDGSGNIRGQLRAAAKLLAEAGWEIKDGVLVGPDGAPLEIEFLIDEPTFERIIGPFIKNLEKLGIAARIRTVDSAQYQNRFEQFDYDVVVARFLMSMTPGVEQRNMWGSEAADLPGSYNLSGIKNPVVDALIEQAVAAPDRASLTTIVRALDRVLMWNHYVVPQWYKAVHNIAYWDKFTRPAMKPKFAPGYHDTWWFDRDKAKALEVARSGSKG